VLRPRRIVELGTHSGVSYAAMCQTVKTLGLATSCFAIDTWKGDEHAGSYGEDVYRDFAAFHDRRYGAFSKLMRSRFDDALHRFEDGSVDLLHIDGLHTYEAVRRDYESWLPKLAANAVVLFHDIEVREREFGVFRLWEEITADRLHFSFLHGHGLGVLGCGEDYPDDLLGLFRADEDSRFAGAIRETFATLGRSVRHASELDRQRRKIDALQKAVRAQARQIEECAHRDVQRDTPRDTIFQRMTWPLRLVERHMRRMRKRLLRGVKLRLDTRLGSEVRPREAAAGPAASEAVPRQMVDTYIAIPFKFEVAPIAPPPSLIVVLHCYYIDKLETLQTAIGRIPFEFTTVVTTDTNEKKDAIESAFAGWKKGALEVVVTENRGRDIAPRFVALRNRFSQFEYVLFVHTKKSVQDPRFSGWLEFILDDLLPSADGVSSVFTMFSRNRKLGIVMPRYYPLIRPHTGFGLNLEHCQAMARRLGFILTKQDPVDFPAGSMFWARTAALAPLLDLNFRAEDFEPEKSQVDGTLAHAIERMICFACELSGYQWCISGRRGHTREEDRTLDIPSLDAIDAATAAASRPLLPARTGGLDGPIM
jgi:hypothetical protein